MTGLGSKLKRRTVSGIATLIVMTLFIMAGVIGVFGVTRSADAASNNSRKCYGTYLMTETGGVQSLWTFDSHGTLQVTSSAEDFVDQFNSGFSHAQGAWQRVKQATVATTALDFARDGVSEVTSIARVDSELTFNNACRDVSGSFDLRFYAPPADPLDIDAYDFIIEDFPIAGRLVTTD